MDDNLVLEETGCPTCGERHTDELLIHEPEDNDCICGIDHDDVRVTCQKCGTVYSLGDGSTMAERTIVSTKDKGQTMCYVVMFGVFCILVGIFTLGYRQPNNTL